MSELTDFIYSTENNGYIATHNYYNGTVKVEMELKDGQKIEIEDEETKEGIERIKQYINLQLNKSV